MQHIPFGQAAVDFRWCTGIEDTFVPQTRPGMRALDEYELMGHYQRWRDHLLLARECGAQMIRWGIPWYRLEPEPGVFDWSWTDQVLPYMVEELGLQPILDLVHYGTPLWMDRSFASPRYPEAVARYAGAVAERYSHLVRYYTPLNEPIINALYCGMRGQWPPYLRGMRGYLTVGMALAKGMLLTVRAIKAADPQAVMVFVEAAGLSRADRAELEPIAETQRLRDYFFFDLLTGRITTAHPLYSWLLTNGVRFNDLHLFLNDPVAIDILGLNFYPQWSTRQIGLTAQGALRWQAVERDGVGFAELISNFYERYRAPIMITETSAKDGLPIKRHWLESSVATVRGLRQSGVPVIGYTWFPLFTMIDWRYRVGRRALEDYVVELGLYESTRGADGGFRFTPTDLVERFRDLTRNPYAAVGDLALP